MSLLGHLRPLCALTLIAVALAKTPAVVFAQDFVTPSPVASNLLELVQVPVVATGSTAPHPAPAPTSSGRGVLVPLYVSFAVLQAHSTLRGIHGGAVERNPMLHSIAKTPAVLFAVKAGVAASTIVLADKVRGRSRVGAIVLMAGLNSLYATVVAHNYAAVR